MLWFLNTVLWTDSSNLALSILLHLFLEYQNGHDWTQRSQ
ncbi:hypothetical protein Gotur_014650 [Gossypium turneri]